MAACIVSPRTRGRRRRSSRGQDDYCVTLRPTEREIDYSCDCPIGLEGEFCKHLVAAGLAWIDSDAEGKGKTGKKRKRATTEDDLRAFLERQEKDTLVAMLARAAMENRNLARSPAA